MEEESAPVQHAEGDTGPREGRVSVFDGPAQPARDQLLSESFWAAEADLAQPAEMEERAIAESSFDQRQESQHSQTAATTSPRGGNEEKAAGHRRLSYVRRRVVIKIRAVHAMSCKSFASFRLSQRNEEGGFHRSAHLSLDGG